MAQTTDNAEAWVRAWLEVPEGQIEVAEGLLWNLGAGGVETQDHTTLAEGRAPLEVGVARAVAFFGGLDPEALVADIKSHAAMWGLGDAIQTEAAVFTDESWKERWKQFFKPTRVSKRLAVRPPWETYDAPEGVHVLVIEPGMAFGTGTHATTQLCLSFMDELFAEAAPARLLDVGCGSGILSMGAAMLDAEVAIDALDVDPEALRVSRENFALAGFDQRIGLLGQRVEDAPEGYDLVVANILSHILVSIRHELHRTTAPGGRLLLSGIGAPDEGSVTEHFKALGLLLESRRDDQGWVALCFRRPGTEG